MHNLPKSRAWLILVLLAVAAYAPALSNGFIWDDDLLITENPLIRNFHYLPEAFTTDLFHDYTVRVASHYRPLQTLTLSLDYAIWGHNAFGYHLTNLVLHLLCVLLLAEFIERLSANRFLALLVAGLFAVHPVNSSAIAYIAGRADPLAFAFMLASLLLFVSNHGRPTTYVLSLVCFVGALFSRENAMLLPLLVMLTSVIYIRSGKHRYRRAFMDALPYLLITIAFYYWRTQVLASTGKLLSQGYALPVGIRIQVALRSLATYAGLLVWPAHLQMERQLVNGGPYLHWLTVAGLAVAGSLVAGIFWTRQRLPLACFGFCWFIGTIAPLTGLLSLNASVAEHWLYVPAVGIYLAVAALIDKYRPSLAIPILIVAFAGFTTRTVFRCRDWSTPVALYTQTKSAATYSTTVRANLGNEFAKAGQLNRALDELQTVERLEPQSPRVKVNLANLYLRNGDLDRARQKAEECLTLEPANTSALLQLADILDAKGQPDLAVTYFVRASATTTDIRPRIRHAAFLLKQHRLTQAQSVAQECLRLDPYSAVAHNLLGVTLCELERLPEAQGAFENANKLDRHSPDALINLGKLATQQNDSTRAEEYYQQALQRQPNDPRAHYQLGLIYWKQGNLTAARDHLQASHDAAPASATVREALDRVQHGEPYTQP